MQLVDQWRSVRDDLPGDWEEARLDVTVTRAEQRSRAAALLGPAGPGVVGDSLRMVVRRAGGAVGPEAVTRLLARLDEERIRGGVALAGTSERAKEVEAPRTSAAEAWRAALATLPADWSDLYCEVQLTSSDLLDRGALLLAPVNPARVPGRSAFRFRVAQSFGYGASAAMTARCFERLDADGIPATVTLLHVLSDTHNVATQGPVWRVGGRAV